MRALFARFPFALSATSCMFPPRRVGGSSLTSKVLRWPVAMATTPSRGHRGACVGKKREEELERLNGLLASELKQAGRDVLAWKIPLVAILNRQLNRTIVLDRSEIERVIQAKDLELESFQDPESGQMIVRVEDLSALRQANVAPPAPPEAPRLWTPG